MRASTSSKAAAPAAAPSPRPPPRRGAGRAAAAAAAAPAAAGPGRPRLHRPPALAGLQGRRRQRHPAPDLRGLRAELRGRPRGEGDGDDQAGRRARGTRRSTSSSRPTSRSWRRSASRRTSCGSRPPTRSSTRSSAAAASRRTRRRPSTPQQALEPLFTKTFAISYIEAAKIDGLRRQAREASSPTAGMIQFDERTKTHHRPGHAPRSSTRSTQMILTWTRPTPGGPRRGPDRRGHERLRPAARRPVERERASRTPPTATRRTFAFPNSVQRRRHRRAAPAASNYLVNLPAAAADGGHRLLASATSPTRCRLDLRLSAMEKHGQDKILSNPKVLVIQNEKAIINVGSQLPIPKTDADGQPHRGVEGRRHHARGQAAGHERQAGLHGDQDREVLAGRRTSRRPRARCSRSTPAAPSTKVLIADGETTVIGGIFIQENIESDDVDPRALEDPAPRLALQEQERHRERKRS